mmetsp:Transcript_20405/g.55634  ORF Transcript_20405/g.55634 Transcript_20405/m.55634 type:complete len:201 (-) Transcript_20405:177-779(-)
MVPYTYLAERKVVGPAERKVGPPLLWRLVRQRSSRLSPSTLIWASQSGRPPSWKGSTAACSKTAAMSHCPGSAAGPWSAFHFGAAAGRPWEAAARSAPAAGCSATAAGRSASARSRPGATAGCSRSAPASPGAAAGHSGPAVRCFALAAGQSEFAAAAVMAVSPTASAVELTLATALATALTGPSCRLGATLASQNQPQL